MNHYCTYFDRNYLAQGLSLWESLHPRDPSAVLWVLALDDFTADLLSRLGDARLRVVTLPAVLAANPELALLQTSRPKREFIFALSPVLPAYLFDTRPEIGLIAYLDADLYFFGDPSVLAAELGLGSVLIVPHRYPKWHDDSARYGRFNVGVLLFRRDAAAAACLTWWRARCLDSCALAADGSTYGDQKYLDQWPEKFPGTVVARHPGVNLAPWNWAGHRLTIEAGKVRVDGEELVIYHFAQFRRIDRRWFDSGQLEYGIMPRKLRSVLYDGYWGALRAAEAKVKSHRPEYEFGACGWKSALGPWHLGLLRIVWGQYWRWSGATWFSGRFGLGRFSGRAMAIYRALQRRGR